METKSAVHIVGQSGATTEDNSRIILSGRDWERLVQIMTEDADPTQVALEEAKLFNQGRFDGSRYYWPEQETPLSASGNPEG